MMNISNMGLKHIGIFLIGIIIGVLAVQVIKYLSKDKSEVTVQSNGQKVLLKAV